MRLTRCMGVLAVATLLAGCGALRKPPDLSPHHVPVALHAARGLNLDRGGQPLALAVRLYKLRQKDAFENAPYMTFLDPRLERERLGDDLIEVREIMLAPGQRYEVTEKVARDAGTLGVVALFHTPASGRWRATMRTQDAEREGLRIGLFACALSVGGAAALASAPCQ